MFSARDLGSSWLALVPQRRQRTGTFSSGSAGLPPRMPREEGILLDLEVRRRRASDQEAITGLEGERAAGVLALDDAEVNLHAALSSGCHSHTAIPMLSAPPAASASSISAAHAASAEV